MRSDLDNVRVIACDVFGTVVDWYTGVAEQVDAVAAEVGLALDGAGFALAWRGRYAPSLAGVLDGRREWAYLDTLHRESLDVLLDELGVADAVDEDTRRRLVHAWHRLPAWPDAVEGLGRLRRRFVTATLSNGGFALLTDLVKSAGLPFDAIVSTELFRTYKPDPRAYLAAADLFDVEPAAMMLAAAHPTDLAAASAAGLRTAYVDRPAEQGPGGRRRTPGTVDCDVAAASFVELAELLGC
jgi:2-haloacid dehalogenase